MSNRKREVIFEKKEGSKISSLQFMIGDGELMRRLSEIECSERELYEGTSQRPVRHGVNDERLGISSKKQYCATCGLRLLECAGHFGYVKLHLPVFHLGFFKEILAILNKICKHCSQILLPTQRKLCFMQRLRKVKNLDERKKIRKEILNECKKNLLCPHCGKLNGPVKRVGAMKIIHELYKQKTKEYLPIMDKYYSTFDEAVSRNSDVKTFLKRCQHDLNPVVVLNLFQRISYSDVFLLDMNPRICRPERLIWTHMLVPPCCSRPSVPNIQGTNEDTLTIALTDIIGYNNQLGRDIQNGEKVSNILDLYDQLHLACAQFLNSELPGFPAHQKDSKIKRSLVQRLKGKGGRFRCNLQGKRADFTGRSVISPDPNIAVDEVGMPVYMAKLMTYPERVNRFNIRKMRKLVMNGKEKHPGAYYVTLNNGSKVSLIHMNPTMRKKTALKLQIGNIVERHLDTGDFVLFNRQPSLHRISIMCHRVRVLPYRTLRLNLCACNPYNADFDGDEMNIHFPQTYDAKAEARHLMGVKNNLCTPRHGGVIVSTIQDFITATYVMTAKDCFFSRSEFSQLISESGIEGNIAIPKPAIILPIELWTGKQILRVLLNPYHDYEDSSVNENTNSKEVNLLINYEEAGRNYDKKAGLTYMDKNDGYVVFQRSELVCGQLDKSIVAQGRSLIFLILKNYGPDAAITILSRIAKISARYLMNKGFSIGMNDVIPQGDLMEYKKMLIDKEMEEYLELMKLFENDELKADAGCTVVQTLESKLNKNFSNIRATTGKKCFSELPRSNSLAIMARSGSKGSSTNIAQMTCLVGQQSVGGRRIWDGFINRTLPHFEYFERSPQSKGFVQNSFYTGLNAYEFFFHTMAGREGLVDTAVKTSETGYMQRRLMKAMEDAVVHYDRTVRNSEGVVLQFTYGDDGLDPLGMEYKDGRPIWFERELFSVKNNDAFLSEEEQKKKRKEVVKFYKRISKEDAHFMDEEDEIEFLETKLETEQSSEFTEMFLEAFTSTNNDKEMEDEEETYVPLKKMNEINHKTPFSHHFGDELKSFLDGNIDRMIFDLQFTNYEFIKLLSIIYRKYEKSLVEYGEPVGPSATHSIGEPGTQMTLKTFHFAGVASMDITLGVPRIIEIINATMNIKTPIISGELSFNDSEMAQNIIKGKIERTTLGEICESMIEIEEENEFYVYVEICREILDTLTLGWIDFDHLKKCIVNQRIILDPELIEREDGNLKKSRNFGMKILVPQEKFSKTVSEDSIQQYFYTIQKLKEALKNNVIVSGISTIGRAIIKKEDGKEHLQLLAEGVGLKDIFNVPGVIFENTDTNHIREIEQVLGIEAAREKILNEIHFTMGIYGMKLDDRHLKLLSDIMTYRGVILGFNRTGIIKVKNSPMLNASFEQTQDHLFNAAIHNTKDDLVGVSEAISLGMQIPCGTGMIDCLFDSNFSNVKRKPIKTWLE